MSGLNLMILFLLSVWEVSFDSCLLDQMHAVSFLQMSALGGHFLSVWFEPYVSFLPVSCLRGSNDVCLNWSNVSFQVSVWSDQLMYVWTEPCVSFCQRLSEGFNQCLPLAGAERFFFCKCLSRGDQWTSFWTEPKSFFLC